MMHVTVRDAQGELDEGRTVHFNARTVDAYGGTGSSTVFNAERTTDQFGMVTWSAGFDVEDGETIRVEYSCVDGGCTSRVYTCRYATVADRAGDSDGVFLDGFGDLEGNTPGT